MTLPDIVIRIILVTILAGLVGLDRELKHKPAGAKTHMLVGIGSTLFMMVSIYIYLQYKGADTQVDPGRIAAQVVTGIGFLGAGTIIQARGAVYGLTTAASLWVVAGIGLAVGAGMYGAALVTTVMILLIFAVINRLSMLVESKVKKRGARKRKKGSSRG